MEFWENEEIQEQAALAAAEAQEEVDVGDSDDAIANLVDESVEQDELDLLASEEADDTELLSNARLRLEQGRLYEMLLKHDLFADVDADQRAIANVQKEIRSYIKERLEILLGLRQDPKTLPPQAAVEAISPFTPLEVELLKRFLAKMSKGATEQVVLPPSTARVQVPSGGIKPLSSKPAPKPAPVGAQKPATKKPAVAVAPAPKKAAEPASTINVPSKGVKEQLEALGEYEMPLGGSIDKVSKKTLMERNLRISQRQAARKAQSTNKLPTPMGDQESQVMMSHVVARQAAMAQSGTSPVTLALAKVLSSKSGMSVNDE